MRASPSGVASAGRARSTAPEATASVKAVRLERAQLVGEAEPFRRLPPEIDADARPSPVADADREGRSLGDADGEVLARGRRLNRNGGLAERGRRREVDHYQKRAPAPAQRGHPKSDHLRLSGA